MNAAPPYVIIQAMGKNCTALCMWRWQTAGLGKASQEDRVVQGDFQSLWQGARHTYMNLIRQERDKLRKSIFPLLCRTRTAQSLVRKWGLLCEPSAFSPAWGNVFLREERNGNMYNPCPAFSFGNWFLFGKHLESSIINNFTKVWPPGEGTARSSWWSRWSWLWPLFEIALQV